MRNLEFVKRVSAIWIDPEPRFVERRRFAITLLVSLALHGLVLCIKLASPASAAHHSARVDVTLADSKPSHPETPSRLKSIPQDTRPRILMAKPDAIVEPARTWSQVERDDMNQFLNDLDTEAKPKTGRELAQRALSMAAHLQMPEQRDDEQKEMLQKFTSAQVSPFSIEMYFDALFRKMNRSATMIGKDGLSKGHQVAAVRVIVNQDGSVKNFRILWAADQQSEIAFIKAVVDLATPFPVFPRDIRDATNSVVLVICIQPNNFDGGSGATFSRMSPGQNCRG